MTRTAFRSCPLCEARCGLRFEVEGNRIVSVRGDEDDVASHGYVCPKGIAIGEVQHDPDRLRKPLRKSASGSFEAISWEDAFTLAAERLSDVRRRYGKDSVAVYYGNPVVYDHGALLFIGSFLDALGTRNRFSSNSQDVGPRLGCSYQLYGASWSIPIPDLERCDYFLCIGANPVVSNGSLLTAPDMRGRIRAVRKRGGKVVVVDPRRSETAREADEHVFIRPGTDAALLLAMVGVLVERGAIDGDFLAGSCSGWDTVRSKLSTFSKDRAARRCGVEAATIERLALEFAEAGAATAYSRMGVCVSPHSSAATYATDLLNLVCGRLGREGGAMFATPAMDVSQLVRLAGLDGMARHHSRVRGLPEVLGDLPTSTLAEEIETPGEGRVRALATVAGNPVLSAPNGKRIAAALDKLEFMVSVDLYVNETTRHADLILPPAWSLCDEHVELLFPSVAVRNVARSSPPVLARGPGEHYDWEILRELALRLGGGPSGIPLLDRVLLAAQRIGFRWDPSLFTSLMLRLGPYGDKFMPWSKGLNLARLGAAPHGIDLGPLQPGFERRLFHKDRRIHLDAPALMSAVDEAGAALDADGDRSLLLIGRREIRTNNSWMHNLPSLVSGRDRCVLLVHPHDAAAAGLADGDTASLSSRVHSGEVRVALSDEMMRGVVSLPHGWGHADSAPWQTVAGAHAGVSVNDWTDDQQVESMVGQSILNAVPVRLSR